MQDPILGERISFLHLHMQKINSWPKHVRDGGFNFKGAYIIFESQHCHIQWLAKNCQTWRITFGERASFLWPNILEKANAYTLVALGWLVGLARS